MCAACEMAVSLIQNELRNKETKEDVLKYVNQVKLTSKKCYLLHKTQEMILSSCEKKKKNLFVSSVSTYQVLMENLQ